MLKFTEFLDEEKVKTHEEQEVYQDKIREHLNAQNHYTQRLTKHEQQSVYNYTAESEALNNHLYKTHTNPNSLQLHNNTLKSVPYKGSEQHEEHTKYFSKDIEAYRFCYWKS